jgi:hypothetical protein
MQIAEEATQVAELATYHVEEATQDAEEAMHIAETATYHAEEAT